MKTIKLSSLLVAFLLISLGSSCDDDPSTSCSKTVSVSSVKPNSNPVGFEVLLTTSGFGSSPKVVFGTVAASTRAGGSTGEIIAKVPSGLSGTVEISVEDGNCIARSPGFTVLGSLPTGIQPTLPDIIIPSTPGSLPDLGIQNNWVNAVAAANNSFGVHLNGEFDASGKTSLEGSFEFNYIDDYFNDNPATGTANKLTNVVYLEIDRTAKGGTVEHFDGKFIALPSFLPNTSTFAILFVSRETGRQMLLYV